MLQAAPVAPPTFARTQAYHAQIGGYKIIRLGRCWNNLVVKLWHLLPQMAWYTLPRINFLTGRYWLVHFGREMTDN